MLGWMIVILLLLLILSIPVGIDGAYSADAWYLKLKLAFFRKTLLPGKKTEKAEKKKKEAKKPKAADTKPAKEKKKLHLSLDDILTLAEIGLDALHRFRIHLSVDLFRLHYAAAASDPYAAVLQFGRVNAVLGALLSKAHNSLKIRKEDVQTELDLSADRPQISAGLILTIQIWEILLILLCAGVSGLRWYGRKKRTERAASAAQSERSKEDGEQ